MDYNTLVAAKTTSGSLANWVNRGDLPVSDILTEAQAWLYQRMRVREMTVRAPFTFLINTSSLALPADFLDPIQFLPYEWGFPLPFAHEESMMSPTDDTGALFSDTPSRWSIIGATAYVDVSCSAAFPGILLYYGTPAALSGSNLTNFLTSRYPTLLRYACLGFAYDHMKDTQRKQQYLALAMAEISEAKVTNDMFRRSQYAPS